MEQTNHVPRVFLRRCDDYNPDHIRAIVGECMDELRLKPRGRTLVKPNTVIAHRKFFPNAFTRAELLDGLLAALRERGGQITDLSVGERSGISLPTRWCFAQARYGRVLRRHKARVRYFDEMPQVRRSLFMSGRLRDYIYIPEAVAETEWLVAAPKFKTHPWTKVTFNLKLYIGMQDDEHRLIDHDHHLHTKIADLFEVIQPRLCVVDAIAAGGGARSMLVPQPFPLGLVIVGDNAVATDAVCCHIAGIDPHDVDHIRMTAERGWGPIDLDKIKVDGDVSIEQGRQRAEGHLGAKRIDDDFNSDSSFKVHVGPPPDTYDYCWGGCPGALQEGLAVIQRLQPEVRREARPLHIVLGAYQGEIRTEKKERVVFVGDCARWKGTIAGKSVEIPFLYRQRHLVRPENATASDLVQVILRYFLNRWRYRFKRVVRVPGCTVGVSEAVLYIAGLGRTKNPYFDPRLATRFMLNYVLLKIFRFFGKRRQPSAAALEAVARQGP